MLRKEINCCPTNRWSPTEARQLPQGNGSYGQSSGFGEGPGRGKSAPIPDLPALASQQGGSTRNRHSLRCRHQPAAIDGATGPLSRWAQVREAAFAPAEAIAAEL